MSKYLLAVIQLDTTDDMDDNFRRIEKLVKEAASKGAKLVALPENSNYMQPNRETRPVPEPIPGISTNFYGSLAKKYNVWFHGGTIKEVSGTERGYNTSVLFNPEGEIVETYRKIHLFDIVLEGKPPILESARNMPGNRIVNVQTELGNFGLSVCYDIRFAEMYRIMALNGAEVIFTPANFTTPTGIDHWEPILKTRAIENGCYIIAAAQIGLKMGIGNSFGRSMIIDPWGTVLAKAPNRECVIIAEIDTDNVKKMQNNIPSIGNRREDVYEIIDKSPKSY